MITKAVYPVVFHKCEKGDYFVEIPDLDVMTQGLDLADAIEMARDVIKLTILDLEEEGKAIPAAGSVEIAAPQDGFVSYVDIDMRGYREKYGNKSVKKNCTLPQWLCVMAEEQHINFSKVLQEALIARLGC